MSASEPEVQVIPPGSCEAYLTAFPEKLALWR